ELVEDFMDVEDDTGTADVDQPTGVMTPHIHCIDPSEGSMSTAGNELLPAADELGKNAEPYLGMEFVSDAAARAFYNAYALGLGFGIRVARSRSERRKGSEVLVMKRFVCMKEGHHKKKDVDSSNKKKRKRLSIRDGCPAMMEVVRRGPEKWVITKLVLEHTHVIVSPDKVREVQLLRLSGKEHADQLQQVRRNVFGDTGASGLFTYLMKRQSDNSGFFYNVQVDSGNCLRNAVWVDARSKMSYKYFGDAVYFDTTYTQNENMLPFAAFTGMNHHELSLTRRAETISGFYRNNFSTRAPLLSFITTFDQHIDRLYMNEAQKDLASFPPEQLLKTNSILEKQAASIYTRAAFEFFQTELIESLHHYAVKVQESPYEAKYYVERDGDPPTRHTVVYNVAEKKAWCDCCRFAFSAILCRHVLGVFILADIDMIPEPCITKRWTKKAKTGPVFVGRILEDENRHADSV
uniref:Protein FAR1-RELATED SEQUENCE n=1 Tax=Aegilops tauschii subsp. strangulata TaxID=200361 RepID=A0A453SAY9_AEGTS